MRINTREIRIPGKTDLELDQILPLINPQVVW